MIKRFWMVKNGREERIAVGEGFAVGYIGCVRDVSGTIGSDILGSLEHGNKH